ncbi:histidine kinase [Opitutaceae bacterium TAV5]|nr:histidine kinase [Opitutaceae bacterium TAV5]
MPRSTPPSLDDVCERALQLPSAPTLLPRLLDALEQADTTIDEMEAVIRVDPVLAGSVLRLANSAHFAASDMRVESLHEAVLRLGQKEIYRLAALSVAGCWAMYETGGYGWEPGDFCRATLVTAVAAEVLAGRSGWVKPEVAYAAGLVQGLGKLALAWSCGGEFPAIRRYRKKHDCLWPEAETAVLGYNHATVTAGLLRRWRFPEMFVAAAENNPPEASMDARYLPLAVHLHAANYLAASFGAGQGEDAFLVRLNAPLLEEWGFTAGVLEAALPEVFGRATRLLRDKLYTGRIVF